MQINYKDLFSTQSTDYAKYRPKYPDELFDYLASLVPSNDLAWDVGTGNGQSALSLTKYFMKIIATDPSETQIKNATLHSKVHYKLGTAEKSHLNNQSVDLITVAQALHWFNQELFFKEAKRVLKAHGIIAFWCYELAQITTEIDTIVLHLYTNILGPYWEKERKLVEEGYKKIRMPFKEIKVQPYTMTATWSFDHLIGYLNTWSALQTYVSKNQSNPINEVLPSLQKAWGETQTRLVKWNLGLRIGENTIT